MPLLEQERRARASLRVRRSTAFLASSLLLTAVLFAQPVSANPGGGTVVGGDATITSGPNTVQIDQKTRIVIIDWKSFNIAKGEATNFSQPDSNSTAVNRIGGNDPSSILGKLTANGRIILINGNGIVFGAGAQINVGSLVATTHDTSNADLMSGKATFSGGARGVVDNQGTITTAPGGIVGLLAGAVSNSGVISARLGTVTIGATSQFTLDFTGDGLISFPIDAKVLARAIDANGKPVEALIVNNGRIEGATVLLSVNAAANLVTNVVSMGGVISATNARNDGGKIILDGGDGGVSISGTLTASSQSGSGGAITIKGGRIALTGATVSAGGPSHGGSIAIGDWTTAHVTVDAATRLDASAHRPPDTGSPPSTPSPSPAVVPTPQYSAPAQAVRGEGVRFGNDFARVDRGATGFGTSVQFNVDDQSFVPVGSDEVSAPVNDMWRIGRGFVGYGANVPSLGSEDAATPILANDMGHIDVTDVAPVPPASFGDGGTITIIAQDLEFHGTALVQGGRLSGTGGKVETSGGTVDFDGAVIDASAVAGHTGDWLIDPVDLTVNSSAAATIATNLATANVTLLTTATTASGPGSQSAGNGDITISAAITWASSNTLTINAHRNIAINAAINATNGGLYLSAGTVDPGTFIPSAGAITATAAVNVNTFTLGEGNWTQSGSSLPAFTARNFSFDPNTWFFDGSSGSFLRVKSGDGSAGNPYQITDVYGLMGIGSSAPLTTKNYKLVNNIDASVLADFTAIGADTLSSWQGVLDGQNFTIDRLTSTGAATGFAGLFGFFHNGTVKNLNLTNVTIGGALATEAGAIAAQTDNAGSVIQNVTVTGGTVTALFISGGLAASNTGSISNSSASVTVIQSTTTMSGTRAAGGLVGENFLGAIITQSYATGRVNGMKQAGGLVGLNNGTISQSYATGAVTLSPLSGSAGTASMGAGGFVGVNVVAGSSAATITQSYASGSVTLSNANSANVSVGSFVGGNGGTINEAFATGYVSIASGSGTLAGFAGAGTAVNNSGQTKTGTLTNTYYDNSTTGQSGGSTTAQLQGTLPSGFNTVTSGIWATGTGLYPYFAWRYATTPQAITGTAYSDSGVTLLKGGVVTGQVVGTNIGSSSTGANGYYYLLAPSGTIAGGGSAALVYIVGSNGGARTYTLTGSTTGFDILGAMLIAPTTATLLSTASATTLQVQDATMISTAVGSNTTASTAVAALNRYGYIAGSGFTIDQAQTLAGSNGIYVKTLAGDIAVTSALSLANGGLTLDAFHGLSTSANLVVSGSGKVVLTTNDGGTGGDYIFFGGTSLQFTGAESSSAALLINGTSFSLLYTMAEIQAINASNTTLNGNYALANPLNAASTSGWISIGTDGHGTRTNTNGFAGIFEGLGNTVSNLAITSTSAFTGFFGGSSGTIRDFGIVGGSVTATGTSSNDAGGLVGDNHGTIKYSFSSATVTIAGSAAGGLVGINALGTIVDSYSTGNVSAGANAGGLAGTSNGTITDSYATGSAHSANSFAGALVAQVTGGSITDAYGTGAVSGTSNIGGAIGSNNGTITNVYWDTTTTGQSTSAAGTGLTTAALQAGPTGLNASPWIATSGLYPYLYWQVAPTPALSSNTVSGNVYSDYGVTALAGAHVIEAFLTGGSVITTATSAVSTGAYSLSAPLSNSLLLLFLDNSGGQFATTVVNYTGTSLTGVNLYAGYLNVINTSAVSVSSLFSGLSSFVAPNGGYSANDFLLTAGSGTITPTKGLAVSSLGDFNVDQALSFTGGNSLAVKTAAGDISINSAITLDNGGLTLDAYHGITINAPIAVSGAGQVVLKTNDGGSGGAYSFGLLSLGSTAKLTFTGTEGTGQSLTINGTAYNLIYTAAELQAINANTTALTKPYALAKTIDLSGISNFTAIGSLVVGGVFQPFNGIFDGLNNTIAGLTQFNPTSFGGLFGFTEAAILRNINLANISITVDGTGAVPGDVGGLVANANQNTTSHIGTTLSNIVVSGAISINPKNSQSIIGGVIGLLEQNGTAINLASSVTVSETATNVASTHTVGGLVGNNDATISQSYATGAVTGSQYVGGFVGRNGGTITQSYATGAVLLNNPAATAGATNTVNGSITLFAGGFAGFDGANGSTFPGTITQSYSTGSVTVNAGSSRPGSLNITSAAGGFAGTTTKRFVGDTNNGGILNEVYATGYVSGATQAGGLVGANTSAISGAVAGTLTNSYWDTQTTGQTKISGDAGASTTGGKTTAQLQAALPGGFNTVSSGVWTIVPGVTYPYFGWQFGVGTTPQIITGFAYTDRGVTAFAGGTASVLVNGTNVGSASTGANGYYYILVPQGTIGANNLLLAYLSAGTVQGNTLLQSVSGSVTTADIYGGFLRSVGAATSVSAVATTLSTALGSNSGSSFLFTLSGGGINLTSGASAEFDATGASFVLDKALSAQTLVVSTGGPVTQTAAFTATNLLLLGSGASYALTNTSNAVGTIAANTGSIDLADSSALTIGSIGGTAGVTSSGGVTLKATGNLSIASGAKVTGGAGSTVVLSATGAFVNSQGSDAVVAGAGGRWLIYSADPSGDTFSSLDSANTAIWNATITTLAPGSVSATGNRYIFANQPILTFTTSNASKNYGTDGTSAIANAYTVTGYQGVANAFTTDTAATVFSGAPALSSAGTATGASVASGPYTITAALGTLSALNGYTFDFVNTGTLTVNPAVIDPTALTYSVANATGTYGTLATLGAVTLSGVLLADVGNVSGTITLFDGSNNAVTLSAALGAGAYVQKVTGLTGSAAGNYVLASSGNTNGTLTINPKAITWSVANASGTYGTLASPGAVTLSGVLAGDTANVAGTLGLFDSGNNAVTLAAATHAGNYTEKATALTGSAAGNYVLASSGNTNGTLTINPKALTYSVPSTTGTYGTLASPGAATLTGIVGGDNVQATVTAYDGSNNAVTLAVNTNAGGYTERATALTGSAAGNYVLASSGNTNGTLTINPKALTYSVANATGTYGTLATLGAATFSGVLASDAGNVTGTVGVYDSNNVLVTLSATTGVATYSERVTRLGGSAAGNYILAPNGNTFGTLTINPAILTLTYSVANATGTYGTLAALGAVTLTGVAAADIGQVGATVGVFDGNNNVVLLVATTTAGQYFERVSGLTGSAAGNYVLAVNGNTNGVLTINPKALTWAVANGSGTYGTLASAGAVTLSGVLSGDAANVAGTLGLFDSGKNAVTLAATTNAGAYAERVTTLTGSAAGNYVLASIGNTNGTLTINPKAITWSVANASSTYGTLAAPGAVTFSGVLAGDAANLTGILGLFDSASQAVTLALKTNAGIYAERITGLSGSAASNYVIATSGNTGGALTILPKVLTAALQGAVSRVYDGTTTALLAASNYLLSGVLSGDTVALNNPTTGSFGDKNVGSGKTVSVNGLSISGTSASNYLLGASTISAAIGTITPKTLTASLTGALTRIYDGTTATALGASNYLLSGIVSGDVVALNNPVAGSFDTKNVGTGKIISVAGLAISGGDAGNYLLGSSAISAAIGTITPKTLTVSLTGTVNRVYDGATAALLGAANYLLAGAVAGDVITLNNPANGTFDNKNVGTGKTVTVTGLAIAGAGAANYVLGAPTISGAIGMISPKTLTITAADETKTFGDVDPFLAYSLAGLVDGDTITGLLARALGEDAASYAIGVGTVSAGANYSIVFFGGTFLIIPASTSSGQKTVSETTSFGVDDNKSNASNDNQPGGSILCKVDNSVGDCRLGVN